MFKSSRLVLLAVAALMVFGLAFAACGGGSENKAGDGGTEAGSCVVCDTPGCGETVGVTDTSMKIGTLLPMSNTTATAWGVPLSQGMKAYFDYINDNGGIYGRKLELVVGDSQYTGPGGQRDGQEADRAGQGLRFHGQPGHRGRNGRLHVPGGARRPRHVHPHR